MAKSSKKANRTSVDPIKFKVGFLILLTVVLCCSGYLLFTKNNGETSINEPVRIEAQN